MKSVTYKCKEYKSVKALCADLGISLSAYYSRKRKGLSLTERARPRSEWLRKPVTAGGVEYESIEDFCAARGISRTAYYQAVKDGRPLESVKPLRIGVDYDGVHYASIRAASRALKLSCKKVKILIESQNQTERTK